MEKQTKPKPSGASMAKKILAAAVIIFIGTVLGVAGYLVKNKPIKSPQTTSTLTPASAPDETADWKSYINKELGIDFELSNKFIEVFGIPDNTFFPKEGAKGKVLYFRFPKKYIGESGVGIIFAAYTPNYEPPFYQSWGFYDWIGTGDVTKECPHQLEYETNRVCKIIEVGQEKAVFEVYLSTAEISCGLYINIYFNNRSNSPYKGLNFSLSLPDAEDKICESYKIFETLESESKFYSQFNSQAKNIIENKNLSERDEERLNLFNQMLSTFKFIEK